MLEADMLAEGLNLAVYIVPVLALIISVITLMKASEERHDRSAAEQAGISLKLDSQSETLNKIEGQQVELLEGYHENHESIVQVKAEIDELKRRVNMLEKDVKNLMR